MTKFQYFSIVFCLIQLALVTLRLRRSRRLLDLAFLTLWVAAIVLLLDPEISSLLARPLGIGRGVDLIFYVMSFTFLWAHYQHYIRYRQLETSITKLVRKLAIDGAREPTRPSEQMPPGN